MKVYVLVSRMNMKDFRDIYGETAPDHECIVGIFANRADAEAAKEKSQKVSLQSVVDYGCDPTWYDVHEYDVH